MSREFLKFNIFESSKIKEIKEILNEIYNKIEDTSEQKKERKKVNEVMEKVKMSEKENSEN